MVSRYQSGDRPRSAITFKKWNRTSTLWRELSTLPTKNSSFAERQSCAHAHLSSSALSNAGTTTLARHTGNSILLFMALRC